MRDIAQAAGVSAGLVSRVLRGRRGDIAISSATKQRIFDEAKKANYTPDARAGNLRTGSSSLIGVLARQIEGLGNSVFYNALALGLAEQGKQIVLGVHLNNPDAIGHQIRMFRSYRTQAVVAVASGTGVIEDAVIEQLRKGAHECGPFICVGDIAGHEGTVNVVTGHEACAGHVLQLLTQEGVKQVVAVAQEGPYGSFFLSRYEKSSAAHADMSFTGILGRTAAADLGGRVVEAIRKRPGNGPLVIIAHNASLALNILLAAREAGYEAPGDYGLISQGAPECEIGIRPRLTCVDAMECERQMVRKTLELVGGLDRGVKPEPKRYELTDVRVLAGESFVFSRSGR